MNVVDEFASNLSQKRSVHDVIVAFGFENDAIRAKVKAKFTNFWIVMFFPWSLRVPCFLCWKESIVKSKRHSICLASLEFSKKEKRKSMNYRLEPTYYKVK
jgi:hypothetical protein